MMYQLVLLVSILITLFVVGFLSSVLIKFLNRRQEAFYKKREQERNTNRNKYQSWEKYSSRIPNNNHSYIESKKTTPDCIAYFGFKEIPTEDELKIKYRELAKVKHPDMGGNKNEFEELNRNYQDALLQVKK